MDNLYLIFGGQLERQKRPGYNPNERRLDALQAEPSDDDESVED
jgi:hypothetical protein